MLSTLTLYQVCNNDIQKNQIYDFAKYYVDNENNSSLHHNVLKVYQSRQMRGEYVGILDWNFKNDHKLNLKESKICGNYDMYLPPIGINKRHDVFSEIRKNNLYVIETIRELMDFLKIPRNTKPTLGIYENSVIAKKEIYKEYILDYLRPSITFLNGKGISHEVSVMILNTLWSIYYEHNKNKIKVKTFRRNTIEQKYLINVVDLESDTKIYEHILDEFPYPINVLKINGENSGFYSNLKEKIYVNVDSYKKIVEDSVDLVNARFIINQKLYEDIFINNFIDNQYQIMAYGDNAAILNENFEDIEYFDEIERTITNEIHITQLDNSNMIHSKTPIMYLFYMQGNNKNKKVMENFVDENVKLLKKKGIKFVWY